METVPDLYNSDFYEWALTNAHLLRKGLISEIDFQHIADELEDMGQKEKRELKSQLRRLIVHLLKWRFQPEKRTIRLSDSNIENRSWRDSIINSRREIEDILESSPSLKRTIPSLVENLYPKCIESAIQETGLKPDVFPEKFPFSQEELLSEQFWPEGE
ncbi:MAG: DUF29 domain-containing protein [Nitrospirae bacterium]|jgi:hypothetical protein|nr:DUF29 domain-containing protein [Nitrospirota bacterium]